MKPLSKQYAKAKERANSSPLSYAKYRYNSQKKAAKARGIVWELEPYKDDVILKIANATLCAQSGRKLVHRIDADNPNGPSIDRISSKIGYTISNIQITTSSVNIAKMSSEEKEFYEMCKDVVAHLSYKYERQ
jgi:hypothetical protein